MKSELNKKYQVNSKLTLNELNKEYDEIKKDGIEIDCIIIYIHMPSGENEAIVNPNVAEKIKYINKTYDDNLVHKSCKDIYITDVIFALDQITEMDFGEALEYLKDGAKVARKGWNGKGMFIYYVPENEYNATTDIAKAEFGEKVKYNPYLAIKNVNGTVSTWVPSVNDCLANDWEVIE